MPYEKEEIDLKNPMLGARLLRDAKGAFPQEVWKTYFWEHSNHWRPVLAWSADPDEMPIEPRQAIKEAMKLVEGEIIEPLVRGYSHIDFYDDTKQTFIRVLEAARHASDILGRGSSWSAKRGQPASMRPTAVRAFVIRKFNPHPTKQGESSIKWAKLADLLFLENGTCPRTVRGVAGTKTCGVTRHQYDDLCVKALETAVNHLHNAMKHDRIPV